MLSVVAAARTSPTNYRIVAAMMALIIIYGSLYPFAFSVPEGGDGAIAVLLGSWADPPIPRDFLSNILLYLPLGCFAMLGSRPGHPLRRLGMVIGAAAALSVAIELTQYFDIGRDTEAPDVYANTIGGALGAVAGVLFARCRGRDRAAGPNPVAALVLVSLAGGQLYPYLPDFAAQRLADAGAAFVRWSTLDPFDLYSATVIWLTWCAAVTALRGPRGATAIAAATIAALLATRLLVPDAEPIAVEGVGAVLALLLWPVLLRLGRRRRGGVLFALFLCFVIAGRLAPFRILPVPHPFIWIPFHSLMTGSIDDDVTAFFAKFFFYGGLLFLAREAGWPRLAAAAGIAAMLLVTSWAETYLPGRSAEITDALMAVLIAAAFALIDEGRAAAVRAAS